MIAIVDYGVGNLFSLRCSLQKIGLASSVTGDGKEILSATHIILPGVGAFGDAMNSLKRTRLDSVLKEAAERGRAILGICLGMQLLFEKSYEYGVHEGLGIIPGEVTPMEGKTKGHKVPHMGWNSLVLKNPCQIFRDTKSGEYMYFVHSYSAETDAKYVTAVCDYGCDVCAAAANGNVSGTQFHPEKSGNAGLKILKAFAETKVKK